MLTMRPQRPRAIGSSSGWVTWKKPCSETSTTRFQRASSIPAIGASSWIPALLTTTCTGPSASSRWIASPVAAASATSKATASALPPASRIASATASARARLALPWTTTRKPSAASRRQMAAPISPLPPVTRARRGAGGAFPCCPCIPALWPTGIMGRATGAPAGRPHGAKMPASLLDFLAGGLLQPGWLALLVYLLVVTQLTIFTVTLYLHRSQAHRGVDFHPAIAHFFRFWGWLTTSMVTREWVAIHRKHHAKCETDEDPHSPVKKGIGTVFWRGVELYREARADRE